MTTAIGMTMLISTAVEVRNHPRLPSGGGGKTRSRIRLKFPSNLEKNRDIAAAITLSCATKTPFTRRDGAAASSALVCASVVVGVATGGGNGALADGARVD